MEKKWDALYDFYDLSYGQFSEDCRNHKLNAYLASYRSKFPDFSLTLCQIQNSLTNFKIH